MLSPFRSSGRVVDCGGRLSYELKAFQAVYWLDVAWSVALNVSVCAVAKDRGSATDGYEGGSGWQQSREFVDNRLTLHAGVA